MKQAGQIDKFLTSSVNSLAVFCMTVGLSCEKQTILAAAASNVKLFQCLHYVLHLDISRLVSHFMSGQKLIHHLTPLTILTP